MRWQREPYIKRQLLLLLLLLFLLGVGHRVRDVDKGDIHENTNRDLYHFKKAKINYTFNCDMVLKADWNIILLFFFFFSRITLFQKVIGYFMGIRIGYCFLLIEVWLIKMTKSTWYVQFSLWAKYLGKCPWENEKLKEPQR